MLRATFLGTLVGDQTVTPLGSTAGAKRPAQIEITVGGGAPTGAAAFELAAGHAATLLGITGRDPLGAMLTQQMSSRVPGIVQIPTASRSRLTVILRDGGEAGQSVLYTMRSQIDASATLAAVRPHLASAAPLLIASLTADDAGLLEELLDLAPLATYVLPTLNQLQDERSLELLKRASYMQMNEHEGEMVTGSRDPFETLTVLRERGFGGTLIVTGVDRGIHSLHRGEWLRAPSLEVEAVNDVGAGDTVAGTVLAGVSLGKDFEEALQGAAAAAAMHVSKHPRTGGWDELMAFSQRTPARPLHPRRQVSWLSESSAWLETGPSVMAVPEFLFTPVCEISD